MKADEFNPDELDPGIRDFVLELRALGFNTSDSGDGVSKPEDERVFHCRHVACSVTPETLISEAYRLMHEIDDTWRIEATYSPNDGSAILLILPAVQR